VSRQECGVCSLEHTKTRHKLDHKALELRVQELEFEARVAETDINNDRLTHDTSSLVQPETHTDGFRYPITVAQEERYNSVVSELVTAQHNLSVFKARCPAFLFMVERSYPASPIPKAHHRPTSLAALNPGPSSLRHEIKAEDIPDPKRGRLPPKCHNKNDSAIVLRSTTMEVEHVEYLENDYHLDAGIEDTRIEEPNLNLEGEYLDENFVVYDDEAEGTKSLITGWPGEEDRIQEIQEANEVWTEAIAEMDSGKENAWLGLPLRAGCFEEARKAFTETDMAGLGIGF